jgi:antitoxin VapB
VWVALNIKDPQTEKLAAEVAALTGESKTKAVRVALQERRDRLQLRVVTRDHAADFARFLEEEVWPQVPRHVLGKRLARKERERILRYGEHGV